MRIGVLYKREVPNVAYRATGPAEALRAAGHDLEIVVQADDFSFDARPLYRCDVVHIYRRADDPVRQCAVDLQRHGVAVVWDNDDDIRLLPAERQRSTGITGYRAERDFRWQIKMMRRADLVTTTSDHLVASYRKQGARHLKRIENHLFDAQYARTPRSHEGLVIGWVAGLEHVADARALGMSKILGRILERHRAARVVTFGVRLDLDSTRYEHHSFVPLRDLPQHVRKWDVAIAPLADIPLSYARSNVKVKEYAAAGVPWLASARGPYLGLGEREGGRLVEDDGWEQALGDLLASRIQRWRLARRGAKWAASQSIDRNVGKWVAAFQEAIELRKDSASAGDTLPSAGTGR